MTPTRKQILTEPVGRNLDAWVAEHVLGCKPALRADGQWWECTCADRKHGTYLEGDGITFADLRHYSTDIAAAWEVFQVPRQWLYSRRSLFCRELGDMLQQLPSGSREAWPDAVCNLTPENICRAAILAVLPQK